MEIRWRLYLYVVFNCAYCVAKPVSLNEVIAAESLQKQLVHAASPKLEELTEQRFSLNKGLKPLLRATKFKETDSFIPLGKISSLKYRKTFQIKSPLRPKRMKYSLRRHNHKNQSVKREITGNEKLNQKYIPLLRSLSMLFDNLLGADSGESSELRRKRKRVRYYTDTSEILCPCSSKSNPRFKSEEAADTSAEALYDEASSPSETTSETPNPSTTGHFRGFRQNKNIPLLLPRNSLSGRRDDNGLRKRGRAAHHGSAEGNIARDHGDSEHGTGDGIHGSDATYDEENPSRHSRDHVNSFRLWRGIRDRATSYVPRKRTEEGNGETDAILESAATEIESTLERTGGNLDKPERDNKQQIRRDEAESAELLSAPFRRLRGFVPSAKVDIPESELEITTRIKQDYSGDRQIIDGSSTPPEEDKETSTRHETELINIPIPTIHQESSTTGAVVFIIDGYSVTRHKNGENKLKEKAIHIHSQ